MNIEDIERNLNIHHPTQDQIFSLLLEAVIENNALLRTLLMSQATILAKQDPTKSAVEYENELVDIVNQLKNEKLAVIVKSWKQ